MPKGPQEQKLDEALTGTSFVDIHVSETEWNDGAKRLTDVAKALREAAPDMETGFGGQTGQSAREAFTNVADKADERSTQMASAKEALFAAKMAMVKAQGVRNTMGDMPSLNRLRPPRSPGCTTPTRSGRSAPTPTGWPATTRPWPTVSRRPRRPCGR